MLSRRGSAAIIALVATPAIAQLDRPTMSLSQSWEFRRGGNVDPANAMRADGTWQQVSVPHTWNRVGYYIPSPESHLNRETNIDKYQGVGWYRVTFTPPSSFKGHQAWLQFDAAMPDGL